jgi:hypothetical protein
VLGRLAAYPRCWADNWGWREVTDQLEDGSQARQQLVYRGSTIPVRLGDKVTYRRFPFFRRRAAVVHYVPGQSPPHPEMTEPDLSYWAIKGADGTLFVWPYLPGRMQASRGLAFVSRGDPEYAGLQPGESTGFNDDPASADRTS